MDQQKGSSQPYPAQSAPPFQYQQDPSQQQQPYQQPPYQQQPYGQQPYQQQAQQQYPPQQAPAYGQPHPTYQAYGQAPAYAIAQPIYIQQPVAAAVMVRGSVDGPCGSCGGPVFVSKRMNGTGWLFVILLLLVFWPLCWLPCVCDGPCKDTVIQCTRCGNTVVLSMD